MSAKELERVKRYQYPKRIRVAYIQNIVAPTMEPWFRELSTYTDIQLKVFALREHAVNRPGWRTRQDAGYEVEITRSLLITRQRRLSGSAQSDLSYRIIPINLTWRLWRSHPDVIVVTNATEMLYALPLKWLRRTRIVLSVEDTRLSFSHLGKMQRWFKTLMYRRADRYCAYSTSSQKFLSELGIPKSNVAFTPWAVDNEHFATEAARTNVEELRKKMGLKGTVFICVAALVPRKGIEHLLTVWSSLHPSQHAHATLLLVGDGPDKDRLMRFTQTSSLSNVHFLSHISPQKVAQCFAVADVFVLPTLEDVWGLVVSEAMATGLPILCSCYAGCAPDLVREGINGYTFDPLDHTAFTSLLHNILENLRNLPTMGERSREIIAEFTIERSISEYVETLRAVLKKRSESAII